MRGLVLACGDNPPVAGEIESIQVTAVPARPGKAEVDGLLTGAEHVVVAGTDADLAAVVLRLLRTDRLATTSVGYVPKEQDSVVADIWRLPVDPARALALALRGDVDPVPLIRDDAGGVLVGRGRIGPVRGVGYCDEQTALRGAARDIQVEPDVEGGPGLVIRVLKGLLFKRPTTFSGRAFQLGCVPAVPELDGVRHPRDVNRWTWYRHTEDLRLVRGLI